MRRKKSTAITDELGLPRYLVYDLPMAVLEGDEKVTIQNAGVIRTVRKEKIQTQKRGYTVSVEGEELRIERIDESNVEIAGKIQSVAVRREGKT